MMIPSSITRFVEANWNAIAAVKSAPFRKRDRASATAAYEQDDDAAPRPPAMARDRGESSGRSRRISPLETTAWTTPRECEPQDQRPEDLPEHPEGEGQRVADLSDDVEGLEHGV